MITALPYTIALPGTYTLSRSLSTAQTSGAAIGIEADDVVLDLAGFALDGSAAGAGARATCVGAIGRRNVTIRNGTIRGFARGVSIEDSPPVDRSSGHRIEGLSVEESAEAGVVVVGADVVVLGNRILNTGGGAVTGPRCGVLENEAVSSCGSGAAIRLGDVTPALAPLGPPSRPQNTWRGVKSP